MEAVESTGHRTTHRAARLPSCTDGKLIHGDQQEMVDKLREIHVIESDTLKVRQFQESDIEQYAHHTIKRAGS